MYNPMMNNPMNYPMMNNPMNYPMMNNPMVNNPMMNNLMNYPMMNNPMNYPMMNNPMNYPIANNQMVNNPINNDLMNNMNNNMNNPMMNINNIPIISNMNNPFMKNMNKPMINNININNINNPSTNYMNYPINNNMINNQEITPNMNMNFNQLNEKKDNENFFNLNINEKKIINSIIKFYEDNYKLNSKFMNYEHPQQIKSIINLLNSNINNLKQINENEDERIGELFPYINEPKKSIKFINSNNIAYIVKIPNSISKSDLYSIGDLYKGLYYTNILLIHNNKILENDESSIEDISNGDNIIIIEDRLYPDESYYFSILKKYENERCSKINVVFSFTGFSQKKIFVLSEQTTISEMIHAIHLFYGYDSRDLRILYDANSIEPNEKIIRKLFNSNTISIKGYKKQNDRLFTECRLIGKIITAKLLIDNKSEEVKVGRLNNTKVLFCIDIFHGFGGYKENMRNLYNICVNNIEIKYEDNHSFASLGIKENFNCILKLKNN